MPEQRCRCAGTCERCKQQSSYKDIAAVELHYQELKGLLLEVQDKIKLIKDNGGTLSIYMYENVSGVYFNTNVNIALR